MIPAEEPESGHSGDSTGFASCLSSGAPVLMEGALGERLKREYCLDIDGPAGMAGLVCEQAGRTALGNLWKEYIGIAAACRLPFLATTPTRRANRERICRAGLDGSVIRKNVEFLQEIKRSSGIEMYAGGLMGCKGDAYTGEGALNEKEARQFHRWQAGQFRDAGADFLYAALMPVCAEATGMARALSETGLPYLISFTICRDGKLVDGTTIDRAIRFIDKQVSVPPLGYLTNCIHPGLVHEALSQQFNRTETVRERFIGIQANTSSLSYAELDGSADLKCSPPGELAAWMMKLKADFGLRIFGGCCGTDGTHMAGIARRLRPAEGNSISDF